MELLDQRVVDLAVHGRQDTLLGQCALQDLLDSNRARDADFDGSVSVLQVIALRLQLTKLGHGHVTTGLSAAELAERRGASLLSAVLELDAELVLEQDHVALALTVLHLLLQAGAESVEGVLPGGGLLVREDADPAQTSQDLLSLLGLERSLLVDHTRQGLVIRCRSAEELLGGLSPRDGSGPGLALSLIEETHVDEGLHELGETTVAHRAPIQLVLVVELCHSISQSNVPDDGLGLGDVVALLVGSRVTVGVGNGSKAWNRHVSYEYDHRLNF